MLDYKEMPYFKNSMELFERLGEGRLLPTQGQELWLKVTVTDPNLAEVTIADYVRNVGVIPGMSLEIVKFKDLDNMLVVADWLENAAQKIREAEC